MPLEIGLLGATGIAVRAMVEPARRTGGARIAAVAATDPQRAARFAAEHGVPAVYPDYRALLSDERIDVVYVSLHNSAHAQWAAEAARAGKHVVVEKPLCLSRREAHAVAVAAATAGVRVFEAVMTAGHPWPAELRRLTGHGALRRAHTRIRFPVDLGGGGYRLRPELGGGAFLDAAPYWVQAVQDLAGLDGATVRGRSRFDGPGGADTEFTARLELPGGFVATLDCGFGPYVADHTFSFEDAEVRLRNFLRPSVAAFPVNLVIQPVDGSRRVHSFPAVRYYDAQLTRIVAVLNGEAAHTDTPRRQAARAAVLEDAYACAAGRPC